MILSIDNAKPAIGKPYWNFTVQFVFDDEFVLTVSGWKYFFGKDGKEPGIGAPSMSMPGGKGFYRFVRVSPTLYQRILEAIEKRLVEMGVDL